MYTEIHHCRICGNERLEPLLTLGKQALTGVFPKDSAEHIEVMPIELVKCMGQSTCGLVQLRHSCSPAKMYGMNYGYRSGINQSMVRHLEGIYQQAITMGKPQDGDIILDIGSNDATLLSFYDGTRFTLTGMDPTGEKFRAYYPRNVTLIPDFFSAENFRHTFGSRKAKIITSIAMFYDLEDPQQFVHQITSVLANDGVWILEQSYLPSMLQATAYDTICHEHLEYYALQQIAWLLERAEMEILDVSLDDANGGSFRVTAIKKTHPAFTGRSPKAAALLREEEKLGIENLAIYAAFKERVLMHKSELCKLLDRLNSEGKKVFGLGASTKGNVILQFCGISTKDIPCIAEVNEDKFGSCTPGTGIPIVSQNEADARHPDYYLVLPWHFREGIIRGMSDYLGRGGKLIFPLPALTIVEASVPVAPRQHYAYRL